MSVVFNVGKLSYTKVNQIVREKILEGKKAFEIHGVNGHRYLLAGIKEKITVKIWGTVGLDLGCFMSGPEIYVYGNVQDGCGNTMEEGKITVYGMAGDVVGYSMRGGKIFIKGDVGYRVGIHMKSYQDKHPVIVIGGKAGDFLGEYMAGGTIVVLGIYSQHPERPIVGKFLGTGMHGGAIYLRGKIDPFFLGKNLKVSSLNEEDQAYLKKILKEYCADIGEDLGVLLNEKFFKITPMSHRPYGNLYAY
ncbi:hypothetical protein F1847_03760 [Thermodesulfobacterium sp. TA1]|uniref:GltB/FmdC/FwdC-like GXGXG domain-containing protein n=1 Tax=Thermodesulfobacterium sp. TA1 TaxID=2234087 RepID=UPI0012320A54|nr:hypothetical protein [Thermodesulfobacterium sp. TA1]QER41905.1 hypothetical protein F1847_03760 [Thermodesulfobacterium sp. TA1]